MKKPLIIVIVVCVLVCAVFVAKLVLNSDFLYSGTIEATKIDLSSRTMSVISKINVKEGERVESDTKLLEFSCEDTKLAADLINSNFLRSEKLFKTGSLPQESMDKITNQKKLSELQLSWCSVKAPISATVLSKYHEEGELINVGTKLFTIADLKNVWANIYIPQPLLASVHLDSKVTAYIPELNMKPIEGTITKISDEAEFTPKNVQTRDERTRLVYGIKISFDNSDDLLKPGMTIEIKI